MGRWLEKARKLPGDAPTKPTEPGCVSFVGTPAGNFLEKKQVELVVTTNDPQPKCWLHLLVFADGRVIQRCGEQATVIVEDDAKRRFGNELLRVLAVPDYERPLSKSEIAEALAGTLAAPAPLPQPSSIWLARVARLLGTRPAELLDGGYLQSHDLVELAGSNASLAADAIRSSPAWIKRAKPFVSPEAVMVFEGNAEHQHAANTSVTASMEWLRARDHFYQHLTTCRACNAPSERYCVNGRDLRHNYNSISEKANV